MRNGWVDVALGSVLVIAACKRDSAEVEAERSAADKAALDRAVLLDVALNAVLQKADGFAAKGKDDQAVTTLTDEATPAADRAVEAANALHPSTAWGAARAKELNDLARARRDALPAYVAALRGDDLNAKLGAMETQIRLEKQAMRVLTHVNGQETENDSPLDAGAADAHL